MPYSLLRTALFALDAERSHDLGMKMLSGRVTPPVLKALYGPPVEDTTIHSGLRFANRVGLAAGFDKDARAIDALGSMGFGFVEVGTVTPRAQPGNPKPRLFRLPAHQALINRFGFNNAGVESLKQRASKRSWPGVLGVNIGKNADTPTERAAEDYCTGLEQVAGVADYVTVNVSSPNTEGLRDLQSADALDTLLTRIVHTRKLAAERRDKPLPILLKVSPDLDDAQRSEIADAVLHHGVEGVIASNTTVARDAVAGARHCTETGGLSGSPLRAGTPAIIRSWRKHLGPDTLLIAAGGISLKDDAIRAVDAGADLVQIYTSLIYQGPAVVSQLAGALKDHLDK